MKIRKWFLKYDVLPPALEYCLEYQAAVECMKINGVDYKVFRKCFCCGRHFKEGEHPFSSYVLGAQTSRFICAACAEKVNEGYVASVKLDRTFTEPKEDSVNVEAEKDLMRETPAVPETVSAESAPVESDAKVYVFEDVDPEELRKKQEENLRKQMEKMFGNNINIKVSVIRPEVSDAT